MRGGGGWRGGGSCRGSGRCEFWGLLRERGFGVVRPWRIEVGRGLRAGSLKVEGFAISGVGLRAGHLTRRLGYVCQSSSMLQSYSSSSIHKALLNCHFNVTTSFHSSILLAILTVSQWHPSFSRRLPFQPAQSSTSTKVAGPASQLRLVDKARRELGFTLPCPIPLGSFVVQLQPWSRGAP